MLRLRGFGFCLSLLGLMMGLAGCFPGDGNVDEEQDPHFQRGRNLAGGQDFSGAAREFDLALETNPHSAAAHFELGWLYDTKLNDPAMAVYHYERNLSLQPESPRASLVRERIRGCKQMLANSEFPLPNSRNLQRDVDRLTAENLSLRQQLESVNHQLTAALAVNQARAEATPVAEPLSAGVPPPAPVRVRNSVGGTTAVNTAAGTHIHVVRPGETLTKIAAQSGVRVATLLAANPGINPRRLRVGQSVNIP